MSKSVLYMPMSLDGYIAGPNDEVGNPGDDGFMRPHEWFGDFSHQPERWETCGTNGIHRALVAGRRTVEQVDHWGGDNQGVPIFVPSHRPPDPSVANYPLVNCVLDGIESTMEQAKAVAGNRIVLIHGAYTAQRALEAGVLDELQVHQVPVPFGGGRRLFDVLPARIELDMSGGSTHQRLHISAIAFAAELVSLDPTSEMGVPAFNPVWLN